LRCDPFRQNIFWSLPPTTMQQKHQFFCFARSHSSSR